MEKKTKKKKKLHQRVEPKTWELGGVNLQPLLHDPFPIKEIQSYIRNALQKMEKKEKNVKMEKMGCTRGRTRVMEVGRPRSQPLLHDTLSITLLQS